MKFVKYNLDTIDNAYIISGLQLVHKPSLKPTKTIRYRHKKTAKILS